MAGGAGNDIYFVDSEGDAVFENLSEGNDTVHATISYTIGDHIESLILDGAANIDGAGNGANNAADRQFGRQHSRWPRRPGLPDRQWRQ